MSTLDIYFDGQLNAVVLDDGAQVRIPCADVDDVIERLIAVRERAAGAIRIERRVSLDADGVEWTAAIVRAGDGWSVQGGHVDGQQLSAVAALRAWAYLLDRHALDPDYLGLPDDAVLVCEQEAARAYDEAAHIARHGRAAV